MQQGAHAHAKKAWSCTVRKIELKPGEKIVGYTYNVQAAFISSVPKIPRDWDMTIYNGTTENFPWFSSMASKTTKVGNAIPASYFHDFVRVEMIDEVKDLRPHDSVLIIYASNGSSRRRKFTTLREAVEYKPVAADQLKGDAIFQKTFDIKSQERICDLDLKVESAVISALPKTPRGWNETISTHIGSDGKRRSELHGTIGVGAAALYAEGCRNLWVLQKAQPADSQAMTVIPTLTVGVADLARTTVTRSITIPLAAVK